MVQIHAAKGASNPAQYICFPTLAMFRVSLSFPNEMHNKAVAAMVLCATLSRLQVGVDAFAISKALCHGTHLSAPNG